MYALSVNGPPPPPLPPPLRAPVQQQRNNLNAEAANNMNNNNNPSNNANIYKKNVFGSSNNVAGGVAPVASGNPGAAASNEAVDSDSGLEVIEEPSLRPSELVRGNHNRTMSTISGEFGGVFGGSSLEDIAHTPCMPCCSSIKGSRNQS